MLDLGAATLLLALAAPANAQLARPTKQFTDAFAEDNRGQLCVGDNVRLSALLGEIAKNFSLNLFALPPVPNAPDATVEARAIHWILETSTLSAGDARKIGLTSQQHQALSSIRVELADALRWLQANPDKQAIWVSRVTPIPPEDDYRQSAAIVASLFASLTGANPTIPIQLVCATAPLARPSQVAQPGASDPTDTRNPPVIAVRGKIDDLAIPRFDPGTTTQSKAFEKASQAALAFTDNDEKGEESVAIEATIGIGAQITRRDSLFVFGSYVQNTTETDAISDDDDAKDVRAISLGLLARRSVFPGKLLAGTLGITAYPTFDLAQDARTARARLFISDIAISTGAGPLCDLERDLGPLRLNCRLGAFAEVAHIFEAGRSIDLATLQDDQYLGVGGEVGVSLSLPALDVLAPFILTTDYRYMAVVDGALDDPHRWTIALKYAVPRSNISLELSHIEGANFDTFQPESMEKLSIGFKY